VARTGHTGLAQVYEIFVSRDAKSTVWNAALARGGESGIKAIGWDAWHGAGVAAGVAWDGHEIDGALKISPVEAGYGAEIRVHKPFFVGRASILAKPFPTPNLVTRFRVVDGEPLSCHAGAPIVADGGTDVSWMTSSPTVATEPIGLLYGARSALKPGSRLSVLGSHAPWVHPIQSAPIDETTRITIEVLARYPK
jgi:glycine cleavage system aminomethyltransferase T